MLGIGCEDIQGLDGEMEAATVGELADAGTEGDELGASKVGRAPDEGVADVVDLVLVEAEAVAAGVGVGPLVRGVLDNVLEVVARELEDLFED